MASTAQFWDRHADGYSKRPVKNMEAYDRTMERTRAYLQDTDKVLEIGCGTGTTALRLADAVDRITATDISGRMLEIGQRKADDQNVTNVGFQKFVLDDDTFEPGSFDVILAYNLLHLLEDTPGSLTRIRELLKPGGRFISKSICLKGQGTWMRFLIPVMQLVGMAPHVNFWTVADLEDLVRQAGFEIVETGNYPAKPPSRFIVATRV